MFCPIVNLLALAFSGKAFQKGGIQSPENLLRLEIPDFKGSLVMRWRDDILDVPFFRRDDDTPLQYSDFNDCLEEPGVNAGLRKSETLQPSERRSECYQQYVIVTCKRLYSITDVPWIPK